MYMYVYICIYMFQELPVNQRADAVNSLVYEASARIRDPVYGCVGAISYLQNLVSQLQMQLAVAQAEILGIQMQQEPPVLLRPAAAQQVDHHLSSTTDDHDDDHNGSSFLLQGTNHIPHHQQYLNFASSSVHVTQESFDQRQYSFFGGHGQGHGHGHDMLSYN
ncbi:hypothetical protein Dimus_033415 [Dionaea muscipula]